MAGVLLVLAACASGADEGGPSPTPTPSGPVALEPSGLVLAGVPDGEAHYPAWQRWQMGADGAGMVWLRGPWQLVRLDPTTGEAGVWDAADDLAFASVDAQLVPSAGAGVWLVEPARARLFDGTRFVRTLVIPEELRNVADGPPADGYAFDLVEVGDAVWVSVVDTDRVEEGGMCCVPDPRSAVWVLRWSGGTWTALSDPADGIGGNLAVDAGGAVWAGGPLLPESEGMPGPSVPEVVHRWGGSGWQAPGAGQPDAPTDPGDVVASPTGDVWFVSWADGLRRFDGTRWLRAGGDLSGLFGGGWRQSNGELAVSAEGDAWLAADGLVRVPIDGEPTSYDRDSGYTGLAGLAVAGREVVVLDRVDALRLAGDRFEPLWEGSRAADWVGDPAGLRAPSADEVWIWDADTWVGRAESGWTPAGPQPGVFGPGVFATDGAVWTITLDGLVRVDPGGERRLVAPTPVNGFDSGVVAGPAGSVWVASAGEVRQYAADGTATSIGRPDGWDAVCLSGGGPDGTVWGMRWNGPYPVPEDAEDPELEPCAYPQPVLARWDGRTWTQVGAPPAAGYLGELVGTDDGAAWAVSSGSQAALVRHDGSAWTAFAAVPGYRDLAPQAGGIVCGLGHTESIIVGWVACYSAQGEVARIDVRGLGVQGFAVAPGGEVWVRAPQVARLVDKVPIGG